MINKGIQIDTYNTHIEKFKMNQNTDSKIVNILISDPVLIGEYYKFMKTLNLHHCHQLKITKEYKENPDIYKVFFEIYKNWVSENGSKATVEKLIEILRKEMHNNFIAGK